MKTIRTLLKAPVLTQSGYGVHSRQIFRALMNDPAFDVYVESLNWGHTPFLTEDTDERLEIKDRIQRRIIEKHQGINQYDLFIHVTIPNEFERLGTINVGVTAATETDRIGHVWIQKCNEMDLIVVPSEHSADVIKKTIVQVQDQRSGQIGNIQVQKPVVICNEGVDTNIFKKIEGNKLLNLDLEPDFNFLHVGQWGKGGYGEDRKNIALLVKYFIETFYDRKDVGLVLKVNMARNTATDKKHCMDRLKEIKSNFEEEKVPPIYLVHGNLTNDEMADLYNHPKIKSFISLTHGEGFGLPLLEAAACELPIIATNWSGHLDFLERKKFSAVDYDMKDLPDIAVWEPILVRGSKWAEVDEEDAKRRMKKIVKSYGMPKQWAKDLSLTVRDNFNLNSVCEHFVDVIKQSVLVAESENVAKVDPLQHLQSFIDTPEEFNILYTMPRSAGDVFVSTAVIDGVMKQVPENSKLYFATSPQYADILKGNHHVHKVIPWNQSLLTMDLTEQVFDLVLTPDVATQYTFSNWVRRGHGRLLTEEFANHCQVEPGDYFIDQEGFGEDGNDPPPGITPGDDYMTFHPGAGAGQWSARRYDDWQEVLFNLKRNYPDIKVVQVGMSDEPLIEGIDVDLRGQTNYQQLASVIANSKLHLSIDTFSMHVASGLHTPLVAIFGCSYAKATGPWYKDPTKEKFILIQSERQTGCVEKACYKNACAVNPTNPPINEIDSKDIVKACAAIFDEGKSFNEEEYDRIYPTISGYTTTYNLEGYPFIESVQSMLGFCDEVVIVDGLSDDGTYEKLEELAAADDRIQLYQNPWDLQEPGMDGMQKAFARALCTSDYLWQQDCDEVVHEEDYEKIRGITKKFPEEDILHLPVIEIWGNETQVTGRRHAWKWRLSRNKPEITHGIHKDARLTDEKTGKVYAKPGASDGCEYINAMSYEPLPHTGFYNSQIEMVRLHMPDQYANGMNEVFKHLPSVYHYSWCSLERKINQFKNKWDRQWNVLYQTDNVERFPTVKTDKEIKNFARILFEVGGEESDSVKYKFKLERTNPAVMEGWLKNAPLIYDEEEGG